MLVLAISLVAAGFAGTGSTTGENDTGLQKLPGSLHRQVQIRYPFQASSVVENTNVLFKVNTDIGEIVVMDYRFDDKVFVRSNVCPPCNSIGFTLENGTLVCDSCGTVFDAETGTGIGGGCVAFPKESIPYTISEDKITMKLDDVVTAHEKAIEPN